MSDLPGGWAWTTLGRIAETRLGKMLSAKARSGNGGRPYLRNKNVQWGRVDVDDLFTMDFTDEEFEKFRLRVGDLLVCEGGEVGRSAIWRAPVPECAYQKALHRVRPRGGVLPQFLLYLLMHYSDTHAFDRHVTGSTIAHLPQEDLRRLPVPLPPLAEQRRIVGAIDEQLPRVDSAMSMLEAALVRIEAHRLAVFRNLLKSDDAPLRSVRELFDKNIGGVWGKSPGTGEIDVKVFRVTEFKRGGRLDPATAATRAVTQAQLASRRLQPGDILLEKSGGSTDRPVGRVAWVPDHEGLAVCANFVQLLRVNTAQADSRYVFHWLTRLYAFGVAERFQRATTNIRNLKTQDFLSTPIPVPSVDEQRTIASRVDDAFAASARLTSAVEGARSRALPLRQSVLARAFRGELVPQDPSDEAASVLLERLAAEIAATPKPTRKRKEKTTA